MSTEVVNVLILVLSFTIFAVIHSYLASNKFKNLLIQKAGDLFAFYRLFYNIFALITFYIIYEFTPRPYAPVYELPVPYDIIILIPQIASLILLIYSFRFFSAGEFLGINQVKRWMEKTYDIKEKDEISVLRFDGPYKYSRHPVYLFSILFLALRPQMDLFYLTLLILIIAYFYVGSYFEEKKLVEKFGEKYIEYKQKTGRIFPKIF